MIRNFKLFSDCVTSLRTAEKAYDNNPSPRNKAIMTDLQSKVDDWLDWIKKQQDAELIKNNPPFIRQPQQSSSGRRELDQRMKQRLLKTHSPEEVERFLQSM